MIQMLAAGLTPGVTGASLEIPFLVGINVFVLLWLLAMHVVVFMILRKLRDFRRLKHLLGVLPFRLAVINRAGKYLFIQDPTAQRYSSTGADESLQVFNQLGPEQLQEAHLVLDRVINSKQRDHLQYNRGDEIFWADVCYLPLGFFGEEATLWTSFDITRHYLDNKEISDYATWLNNTLNAVGDVVISMDDSGAVTYMNERGIAAFKLKLSSVVGKKLERIFGKDGEAMQKLYDEAYKKRTKTDQTVLKIGKQQWGCSCYPIVEDERLEAVVLTMWHKS